MIESHFTLLQFNLGAQTFPEFQLVDHELG